MKTFLLALALLCLYGCGSNDGGNDAGSSGSATKVTVNFITVVENASQTFGSIEFTADLPEGVTVPTDSSGIIEPGSLQLADKALTASTRLSLGTYSASNNGVPAKVRISVITVNAVGNGTGIPAGKFATLRCSINENSAVTPLSFNQPYDVITTDAAGVTIPPSLAQVRSEAILE